MRFGRIVITRTHSILIALFILGAVLRSWGFERFPVFGETQDESAWTFLGSSLLQKHEPTSWSYFSGYQQADIYEEAGRRYPLVTPVLDHPPIFALIPGTMQTLTGNGWRSLPSMKAIRAPMVLLGMLNLGLFIWWVRRITNRPVVQVAATAVMATAPSFVFLSRLVVSENLVLTWLLALMCLSTVKLKNRWWQLAVFLLHMALPLTKVAGLPIAVASLAWAWNKRDWRWTKLAAAGTLAGFASWCLYGAWWDWSLFLKVQLQQASRGVGMLSLWNTQFMAKNFVEDASTDIWLWLSWLAGLWWLLLARGKQRENQHEFLRWQAVAMIAFLFMSVGEQTVHGWYRIPLFPVFAFGIGQLVANIWEELSPWAMAIGIFLLAPVIRFPFALLAPEWLHTSQRSLSRVWAVIAGSPLAVTLILPKKAITWQRWLLMAVAFMVIGANALAVIAVRDQTYWRDTLYSREGIF